MDRTMELRVMELLRKQGLRISDLADRMGTDQSNLKKSLANNPKLSTLQDVAKALGVDLHELFTGDRPSRPSGIAVIGGKTYGIAEMGSVVQMPSYSDYSTLRKDVREFVLDSVKEAKSNAFGAFVHSFELFSLVYDDKTRVFILGLFYGNAQAKTFFFDKMEYAEWKNGKDADPDWNLEEMTKDIINTIEGYVSSQSKEPSAINENE